MRSHVRMRILGLFLLVLLPALGGCRLLGPGIDETYANWRYGDLSAEKRVRLFKEAASAKDAEDIIQSFGGDLGWDTPEYAERRWRSKVREEVEALVEIFAFIEERSTPVTAGSSTHLQRLCIISAFSSSPYYVKARTRYVEQMISLASDDVVIEYARERIASMNSGWAEPPFE